MAFTLQTEQYCESKINSTSCTIVFNKYNVYKDFYDDIVYEFPMNKNDEVVRVEVFRREKVVRSSSNDPKAIMPAKLNGLQYRDGSSKQCQKVDNPLSSVLFELGVILEFPTTSPIYGTTINFSLLKKNGLKVGTKSYEMEKTCSIEIVLVEFTDIFQILEPQESDKEYSLSFRYELVYNDQTLIKSIPMSSTQIHAKDFAQNMNDEFVEFFDQKVMCDIVILVEDTTICVHKIVLVSHSPVFASMLVRDMKEENENIVRITDVDTDIFRAFLRYMYTGSIETSVDNIPDLLVLADRYQVNSLTNLCKACLSKKFENKTDYYFRHEINKSEYTSFVVDLKSFATKPLAYEMFTCEFPMNIGDYSCKLTVSHIGEADLELLFSTECQVSCKVFVSFVDTLGKKKATICSMKRKDVIELDFEMRNYKNYVHSDNSLKIRCEVIYVEVETTELPTSTDLRVENFGTHLQKSFHTFFNEKQFCDLTVLVEKSEIPVHKVILAQKSSVFKSLFAKTGAEKIKDTTTIEDTDLVTAKAFFGFMYTGSIDKNEKLIRDVLSLAKKYKVVDLEIICQNYVEQYLDSSVVEALLTWPFEN